MANNGKKTKRCFLACDNCRSSKVKCYNDANVSKKCERCSVQKYTCVYSPKASQLRRKSLTKLNNWDACLLKHSSANHKVGAMHDPMFSRKQIAPADHSLISYKSEVNPPVFMPSKTILLEVSDTFFRNQYQGIFPFIHKPSFQAFIKSSEFNPDTYLDAYREKHEREPHSRPSFLSAPDPLVLLAMLALCARLHPKLVAQYGHFDELVDAHLFQPLTCSKQYSSVSENALKSSNASRYFAWHARNRLKNVFDSPTIQRVQALTMLSSHEWGEINAARSFSYIGLASRMALVLGLGFAGGISYKERKEISNFSSSGLYDQKDGSSRKNWAFIILESKRRTLWSVYMMDRCISSGKNRSSAIKIEDIEISLPCPEKNYIFGEPVGSLNYKELSERIEAQNVLPPTTPGEKKKWISKCSSYAFTIVAFEIWAAISKWVGEVGSREEDHGPWLESSQFFKLSRKIDILEESLPQRLKYNSSNMNAHIAENTAGLFGYLHCLLFISRIFLNREYFYSSPSSLPEGWWQQSTAKLFATIKKSTLLIKSLASVNLMIVAPFTGFEIFTNAGTSLYLDTFPKKLLEQYYTMRSPSDSFPNDIDALKREFKELALQNIELLREWGNVWSLCKLWMDWASQMQTTFKRLGVLITNDPIKKRSLQLALRDYGQNEITEDDVKEDSEQTKKTKLLKDLLTGEVALKIISLLDGETGDEAKCNIPDAIVSADDQNTKLPKFAFTDLIDFNFLESTNLSSFLPGWYDVTDLES